MPSHVLDRGASVVRLRTFAEGLFAKLAHDLALEWSGLDGEATESAGRATLTLPLGGVRVRGVVSGARVDESALSGSDRETCLEKMRREVFEGGPGDVVRVEAELDGVGARLAVTLPRGRVVKLPARPTITRDDGTVHVRATFTVSIAALGAGPVKGPMGAFRVKDGVEVEADLRFVPAPLQPA